LKTVGPAVYQLQHISYQSLYETCWPLSAQWCCDFFTVVMGNSCHKCECVHGLLFSVTNPARMNGQMNCKVWRGSYTCACITCAYFSLYFWHNVAAVNNQCLHSSYVL